MFTFAGIEQLQSLQYLEQAFVFFSIVPPPGHSDTLVGDASHRVWHRAVVQ